MLFVQETATWILDTALVNISVPVVPYVARQDTRGHSGVRKLDIALPASSVSLNFQLLSF